MVRFELSLLPVSIDRIREFEARIGLPLPAEYVEFLLEVNGGQPRPNCAELPLIGEEILVDYLYGLGDPPVGEDLESVYKEYEGFLTEGWLAVGRDPGGNPILMCLEGTAAGRLYFQDGYGFFAASTEEHGIHHLLAPDMQTLLRSLRELGTG
jgi:hypothetical protein